MHMNMASLNYAKEWLRIANRLEWTMIRLQKQLVSAQMDDERAPILAKISTVQVQIDHARTQVNRLSAKPHTSS